MTPDDLTRRVEKLEDETAAIGTWIDQQDFNQAVAGIRRGLESIERGEGRPAEEVFAALRSKYALTDEAASRAETDLPGKRMPA